eukprot:2529118-Rhodomonas_salina.4
MPLISGSVPLVSSQHHAAVAILYANNASTVRRTPGTSSVLKISEGTMEAYYASAVPDITSHARRDGTICSVNTAKSRANTLADSAMRSISTRHSEGDSEEHALRQYPTSHDTRVDRLHHNIYQYWAQSNKHVRR